MKILKLFAGVAALGIAGAASAQDAPAAAEETPAVTFTGTAGFLTDYRFRGVSLSDRDVVGQASITATSSIGLFVGLWGSTIEPIGAEFDSFGNQISNGSEQEIDVTVGFSKAFGNITPTVGVIGYIYPGGHNVAYYEPFVSLAGTLGPVALTVGFNYVPDQKNTADDNSYVYGLAAFSIPDTPVTIKGSIGYEDGFFAYGDNKFDYMIGVDVKYKFITFGLQYIDNDLDDNSFALRNNRKGGIVASITAGF